VGYHRRRALIEEAAAADRRIVLLPRRVTDDELSDLLAAADASVLARSVDWTPSSLVLSLSVSTPVIAADLASNHEHLGAGAVWFAPHAAESLAGALATVVSSSPDALAALGDAGRRHVVERSWNDTADRTACALRAACGRAGVPGAVATLAPA
jgi:glycosyltransferase involved in cell wall biosynthesis